jgi:hypothetical protein
MATWVGFEYREFFDVPRSIVLAHEGGLVLLESAFSDEASDYSDDYQLYLLPRDTDLTGSWTDLSAAAIRRLGAIPVSRVQFDPTRRSKINLASLRPLLP